MDVVDLQRNLLRLAVGAGPASFLQEVLSDLGPEKGSLLVLDPGDLRILHLLQVEFDQPWAIPATGTSRPKRSTQERVVSTRCRREGGNQPSGRLRLSNRGFR